MINSGDLIRIDDKLYFQDVNVSKETNSNFDNEVDKLKENPKIHLIDIVRCKNCKYWAYDNFNDEGEITDAWCGRPYAGFMNMLPDDFCSRGERKDDNKDKH